ncbi:hypothetical protein DRJ54_02835 [Candidatus Acetothermia bacterium]|nr:MAG: hypothetical protein DRJ54_02835 [Candidatus Acetothermia bacterium]
MLLVWSLLSSVAWGQPDWAWGARIATPWDYPEGTVDGWEEGVDRAVADGANVILDWHAVSDHWQALYDPLLSRSLEELARRARYVHTRHPGVRYLVYVAPLEYVTPDVDLDLDGKVDPGAESKSLALQRLDWLQVGIDGRKAAFYGAYPGMPFWVCETCEDVWLTPANPQFRALALEQARRIAATGVDGVWLDVPFLRFEFGEDWQEQWPSFDLFSIRSFEAETGHRVPRPPAGRWPDWGDPAWRAFVRWRYSLISGFLADYRAALRAGNPGTALIVETSVGPDVTATQQGSSTLDLPGVCDVTAHEHDGPWRSAEATYYTWLRFIADLLFWRHTDGGRPAWLLSYVKAGEPDTVDMARLHAAVVLASGFGYYTPGNETMSGVPEAAFRRELFHWLAREGGTYYHPGWRPYANVALVYSQQTLDFLDRGSWAGDFSYHDAFAGMAMMLLESHIPFRVITDRELERLFEYDLAIMPMFSAMSEGQARLIRDYLARGGTVLATGPVSLYDPEGVELSDFRLADVLGVHRWEVEVDRVYVNRYGAGKAVFFWSWDSDWIVTPELDYFWAAEPWPGGRPDARRAESARESFLELFARSGVEPVLTTSAPRGVVLLPYLREGRLSLRAVNFHGVGRGDPVPTPVEVQLTLVLPPRLAVTGERTLEFLGGVEQGTVRGAEVELDFPLQVHTVVELWTAG